jgi:Mg-chelatase subunit ChlD
MSQPYTDFPIAYGTVVPLAPPDQKQQNYQQQTQQQQPQQPQRPTLTNGRSQRVMLPRGDTTQISSACLNVLKDQGFTSGLADALQTNKRAFPLSIWVVDNSGSMMARDGHRILETKGKLQFASCTRWAEMQQTVDYHAQMASLLESPTTFRMLNDPGRVAGPQQFSVGTNADNADQELAVAQSVMWNSQPGGVTPLVQHIHEIRENVLELEPQLRENGTKVAIVLATDGLPTDPQGYSNFTVKQQFVQALRSLEGLPVWIVVRLCTDEDDVVEYYNDLDAQLELSLEVLDDLSAEAQEVHEFNNWLTYGLPLHRMREMGFHHRLFDLLDERKLSKDELRDLFKILFGAGMAEAPDPEADWKGFCETVGRLLSKERKQWNPITKRMEPWIDMKKLNKAYGRRGWFR